MDKKFYRPRIIDSAVEQHLRAFGAVCIEGAKWCGKTWTAQRHAQSAFLVGDPAGNFQNRQLAQIDPSLVLQGKQTRLIIEWQEVPSLWDAVRFTVDQSITKGQFILTGSATPAHKGFMHRELEPVMYAPHVYFQVGRHLSRHINGCCNDRPPLPCLRHSTRGIPASQLFYDCRNPDDAIGENDGRAILLARHS